jgi:hypothetical protein
VTSFLNLGGDALMVVPCPSNSVPVSAYSSIGPFMKTVSMTEIKAFWQRVGSEAMAHILRRGEKPTWMSTSGLGVYWLHLR